MSIQNIDNVFWGFQTEEEALAFLAQHGFDGKTEPHYAIMSIDGTVVNYDTTRKTGYWVSNKDDTDIALVQKERIGWAVVLPREVGNDITVPNLSR